MHRPVERSGGHRSRRRGRSECGWSCLEYAFGGPVLGVNGRYVHHRRRGGITTSSRDALERSVVAYDPYWLRDSEKICSVEISSSTTERICSYPFFFPFADKICSYLVGEKRPEEGDGKKVCRPLSEQKQRINLEEIDRSCEH